MEARDYLTQTIKESISAKQQFLEECGGTLLTVAQLMGERIAQGGKILIFGNGGSAADAQHMAAEMVGRMLVERRPLPALALTTDTSNLTALANDFDYRQVFEKQIEALASSNDLILAISTSGNSENVLRGVEAAKKKGCVTVGLTGGTGGRLVQSVDHVLNVSLGKNSSRIQETHIFAIHSLVDLLDRFFLK